jgi:type IV pilus assembly protein PilY1
MASKVCCKYLSGLLTQHTPHKELVMHRTAAPRFRKHLIALAASSALAPISTSWALDLAEAPPGTVEPYVRPNVIISIDDSGSMAWAVGKGANTGSLTTPNPDGSWNKNAPRMNVLKYSLRAIFDPTHSEYDPSLLPDKKIRLAWQVMHNNGGAPNAANVDSTSMNTNSMRSLAGAHRSNMVSFINSLKPQNGTPSHLMFKQADQYMRQPLDTNSAWASEPGVTGAPYLACRRSYHIMMSDGRWNGTAYAVPDTNYQDNATNLTLPDGVVFGGSTATEQAKTALYRDTTATRTVADWAFFSWAKPMQTSGMTGTLQAAADYRAAPATENFGNDLNGKSAILDRYWNPRYNPATWPHMVTYTIGFSQDAVTWPGASTIVGPTQKVPFNYDNSFLDLVTGNKSWPNMNSEDKRALDMWHAAINGRGRFYAVEEGKDLQKAFREIFQQINTATDPDLSSSATSGSNVSRSEVGKYTAAYRPEEAWKGFVAADKVRKDGTTYPDPNWAGKTTSDKLDELAGVSSRLVLSWSDKWTGSSYQGGVSFKWASDESRLSTSQKLWLQKNVAGTDEGSTKGQQRLDYIRGDRSLEGVDPSGYTASNPFRQRMSRQGDIINSDVWYTGAPAADYLLKGYSSFIRSNKSRPGMLYVGGNDGMLHGFAAQDGAEKIAYVPRGVIPNLTLLTDPQYNNKHKYFVDGSPMTGDVDMNGGIQDPSDPNYGIYIPDWRTLLVGTLGLGGKGYFVLDVTNPTATTTSSGILGLSESNANTLVKLDRTRGFAEPVPNCSALSGTEKTTCLITADEDKDIGAITVKPVRDEIDSMRASQIARMNNNRWAAILGNGYNSSNQRPVLLVQYLDGAKELVRLPVTNDAPGTGKANDNGLGAPRVVDINGDNTVDVVYAGDNQGNMWKFDLNSYNSNEWKVAFGGAPLITVTGPAALGNATRPKTQPISTAPTVRANNRSKIIGSGASAKTVRIGGMMVAFGTGRNITKDDPSNVDVQTIYSVLDNTRYKEVSSPLGKRLEVHPGGGTCPSGDDCIPAPTALGTGVTSAKLAKQVFTDEGTDYAKIDSIDDLKKETWDNFNGWYLDLPSVGERLLKPMEFYDGSSILTVWSQVPAKGSNVNPNIETCDAASVDAERQYRTFVGIMDGKRPSVQIVDINKDNKYNEDDKNVSRAKVTKGPHSIVKKDKFENADIDAKNNKENLASLPEESLRPSWRQLQ